MCSTVSEEAAPEKEKADPRGISIDTPTLARAYRRAKIFYCIQLIQHVLARQSPTPTRGSVSGFIFWK